MSTPLERLRHHVTGAIERGEKEAIVEQTQEKPIMTHTPGPWRIRQDGWRGNYIFGDDPRVNGERCIAEVSVFHDGAENNARLIVAAPAMYEALKALLENEGKREVNGIGMEYDTEALQAAKIKAQQALAQAEGKE